MLRWLVLLLAVAGGCGSEGESASSSGGSAGAAGSAGTAASAGAAGSAGSAGAAGSGGGGVDAGGADAESDAGGGDDDGDGIVDSVEQQLAEAYFPYYSIAPNDKCPRHGVLFRASPHPADTSKVMLWYVVLFERDCGANGHVGDNEVFGAVVDPALPPPAGLLALRAISHQGTLCERVTSCGSLPNCKACTTANKAGAPFPVVFTSVNKHGGYVFESDCDLNIICDFGGCTLNPAPSTPPFVNAGEPAKPLTNDLSTQGFINAAQGWTEPSLMDFDPWGGTDFGKAGNVTDDLQDAAFVVPPGGC